MQALLEKLNIRESNSGASSGMDEWVEDSSAKELISYNPTTNEPIAAIQQAGVEAYEKVTAKAEQSFYSWREVPAPQRGDIVRDLGNALRELKEPLADLVSLEMGKIRRESW